MKFYEALFIPNVEEFKKDLISIMKRKGVNPIEIFDFLSIYLRQVFKEYPIIFYPRDYGWEDFRNAEHFASILCQEISEEYKEEFKKEEI